MTSKIVRHILSLSGGKDSAALAVYMRDRVPEMEYIFHDSGKELPETLQYVDRLEVYLGKQVHRTTPPTSFDHWYTVYGDIIPSNHRRWCTKMLKLEPFENYIGEEPCFNYIGIRADEARIGYISHKKNITPIFPFRDDGKTYSDIVRILEEAGLGLPGYTSWGRTRSGCFFCFYQQKIEWIRLKQKYPDKFEEAKAYEKPNKINGNIFYWCGDESLADLEKPERMAEIEANWIKSQERLKKNTPNQPLVSILAGYEDEDITREGCTICSL